MLGGEDGRELNVADVKGVELTVRECVDVPIRVQHAASEGYQEG